MIGKTLSLPSQCFRGFWNLLKNIFINPIQQV